MKNHWLLLAIFLSVLLATVVLLPVVKVLTDAAVTRSDSFHRMLKYKPETDDGPATYDIGRVTRRLLMVGAIVALIVFRKRLDIGSLATTGLRGSGRGLRELLQGIALGVGSLVLFMVLLTVLGAWEPRESSKSVASVLSKSLVAGAGVGIMEEILFRGFLLQSLAVSLGARWALFWSSAFYSILHFFRAKVYVPVGFDPLIGAKTVGEFFSPLVAEPAVLLDQARWDESIVPGTVGLLLVGVVLGYAFIRTKRLHMSIGLHGGWVFVLKFQKLFIRRSGDELRWLYGGKEVVTGVLGWVFLLALWALLAWRLGRPRDEGEEVVG